MNNKREKGRDPEGSPHRGEVCGLTFRSGHPMPHEGRWHVNIKTTFVGGD